MKTKITQNFFGGNQHAIGKNWTQNALFAHIFLKISRGRPPDPHLKEGDIHSRSYTAKGKNSPASRISERSFEDKNYGKILGGNQHANGKSWTQNAPFASIFLKISRGRPAGPPPVGGGFPLPHPPPAALRADLVTPPPPPPPPPAVDPLDPPLLILSIVYNEIG